VKRLGIRAAELPAEYRRRGAYGVLVESVVADGPAASIGRKAGDVISGVEPGNVRYAVRSVEDLASRLQRVRPGAASIWRSSARAGACTGRSR